MTGSSGIGASGELADRVREFDWGSTPLGPLTGWPQSLRTVTDTMLGSGHGMCLVWGPDRTLLYNDAYAPMLGDQHPEALGRPLKEVWPEIWDDIEPLIDAAFRGETSTFREMPLTMTRKGHPEETWWSFSYSPVRDELGAVAGMLNVTLEASSSVLAARERDRAEEQLRLLNAEMSHRLKNTMSVVQAIATQTLTGADPAVAAEFGNRLRALAAAHDVLLRHSWTTANLRDVAEAALKGFDDGGRVRLEGDSLALGPRATLSMSLLLHELATNATKYGALSTPAGHVTLAWSVEKAGDEPAVSLCWAERGGPPALKPTRRGFGSRIIKMGLVGSGGVELRYEDKGLTAEMTAALHQLQEA